MLIYLLVFSNEDVIRVVCGHVFRRLAEAHCSHANEHVRKSLNASPYDIHWCPGDDGEYQVVATPLIGAEG